MPNFAANYTARAYGQYQSHGYKHTLMIRMGTGETATTAVPVMQAVLAAVRPVVQAMGPQDFRWLDFRFSPANMNLSFPMTWPAATLLSWAGPANVYKVGTTYEMGFEGRSAAGNLTSFSLFGLNHTDAQDDGSANRILVGENPDILNAINALQAIATVRAIDGNQVVWKKYVNMGQNAYWKKRVRG